MLVGVPLYYILVLSVGATMTRLGRIMVAHVSELCIMCFTYYRLYYWGNDTWMWIELKVAT